MELRGVDRARYFAPTAISGYLALLCLALIVTSAFLTRLNDALALTAAGAFGLLLSGSLGLLFWRAQRRDLEFLAVSTTRDATQNFSRVRAAAVAAGWTITAEREAASLEAVAAVSRFAAGDRVAVHFDGSEVEVASICDPGTGFSLVGRERCRGHRQLVLTAVASGPPEATGR